MLTTLLMLMGLAFLNLSEFMPTRRFAELASVTMVAALFGDLVLLPASIVIFGKRLHGEPDRGGRVESTP